MMSRIKNNFKVRTQMDWQQRALAWLVTRSLTVFLILYAVSYILVDYRKVELGVKVRSMQFLSPGAFIPFARFLKEGKGMDSQKWQEYLFYYNKLLDYIPQSPDAYALAGFCYYHVGKYDQAIEDFQKAILLNPSFFWPYYDLGVIYFEQGRFQEALEPLKEAIGKNPQDTLSFMKASDHVYVPILRQYGTDSRKLTANLRRAYRDCYVLLALSHFHLNHFDEMQKVTEYALMANVGDRALFDYYGGIAAFYKKDYAMSIEFFKKSLKENPVEFERHDYLEKSLDILLGASLPQRQFLELDNFLKSKMYLKERLNPKIF